MNEKLKLIREKCIAANPQIRFPFTFGVWVELTTYDENGPYRVIGEIGICQKHKRTREECYDDDRCDVRDGLLIASGSDEEGFYILRKLLDEVEILGRPICLADVIRAIQQFGSAEPSDYADLAAIIWDLHADDLEKQSESTIDFLYQLFDMT